MEKNVYREAFPEIEKMPVGPDVAAAEDSGSSDAKEKEAADAPVIQAEGDDVILVVHYVEGSGGFLLGRAAGA